MNATESAPLIVRWTRRLEDATALDAPVGALEPSVRALFGTGTRASVLRGDWLGHAVHPLLTDVVIGAWTSASVLDLFGARGSPESAKRLIGIGLLAVGPTAWTGWAEWSAAGSRDKRVGLVHAVTNGLAIGSTLRRGSRASGAGTTPGPGSPWPERPYRESAPTWAATSRRHAR